jgi:hypothetical protein
MKIHAAFILWRALDLLCVLERKVTKSGLPLDLPS